MTGLNTTSLPATTTSTNASMSTAATMPMGRDSSLPATAVRVYHAVYGEREAGQSSALPVALGVMGYLAAAPMALLAMLAVGMML